uniref:DNA polymerase n=1 Tax=Escherichia virus LS3 TaxID=2743777 RepID=A0A7D5JH74_9CAUD
MAQVPANGAPYGEICRGAFGAAWNKTDGKPDPWIQVGVDASGLELRCLGNRAAPFDGGAYAKTVVEGDIHWANAVNAGLAPNVPRDKSNHDHEAFRNNAKTFIYAFLYGAGAAKIGLIVGGGKKEGSALMKKFIEGTPAIKDLREAVSNTLISDSKWVDGENIVKWKRRWLRGLDGRRIHIRSPHSALNALLQGDGAVVCKTWFTWLERNLEAKGYVHGWDGDFAIMAFVHDEVQVAARTMEIAEDIVKVAQSTMREVGEFYKFKCVLDTEERFDLKSIWGSDIETNGLLDTVSQFHCGVLINAESNETLKYGVAPMVGIVGGFKEYVQKVEEIAASPDGMLVFHNGINYDVPAIDKLKRLYFGKRFNFPKHKMIDTLVLGRLMYPNIKFSDMGAVKAGRLPPKMMGRQSLEAWGYRLGEMKGEYKHDYVAKCKAEGIEYKAGDEWLFPSQEMLDYNVQDVVVTLALFKKFLTDKYYFQSEQFAFDQIYALRLEHDAAWTCAKMERNGYPMNTEMVEGLYRELTVKRAELLDKLRSTFGSWYAPKGGKEFFKHPRTGKDLPKYPRVVYPKVGSVFKKPKNKAQRLGLEPCEFDSRDTMEGAPFTPITYVEFNPGSGDHLAKVLMERGWEPVDFTDTGKPVVDDETLEHVKLPDEEAQACVELVREYLVVQKRIGQAAEGKNAWLKLVGPDGRMHGSINPCGQ